MLFNLPMLLTSLRVLLVPLLISVYYINTDSKYIIMSSIFLLACITDYFDGYLARKLSQTSKLGEFLDPVADKLIIAVALILLLGMPHLSGLEIPAMVIIGREISVSSLREIMSELGKRTSVMVNWVGKLKTALQMLAVAILLACSPNSPWWFLVVGYVSLYIAVLLTIFSMIVYLRLAWVELIHGK